MARVRQRGWAIFSSCFHESFCLLWTRLVGRCLVLTHAISSFAFIYSVYCTILLYHTVHEGLFALVSWRSEIICRYLLQALWSRFIIFQTRLNSMYQVVWFIQVEYLHLYDLTLPSQIWQSQICTKKCIIMIILPTVSAHLSRISSSPLTDQLPDSMPT